MVYLLLNSNNNLTIPLRIALTLRVLRVFVVKKSVSLYITNIEFEG